MKRIPTLLTLSLALLSVLNARAQLIAEEQFIYANGPLNGGGGTGFNGDWQTTGSGNDVSLPGLSYNDSVSMLNVAGSRVSLTGSNNGSWRYLPAFLGAPGSTFYLSFLAQVNSADYAGVSLYDGSSGFEVLYVGRFGGEANWGIARSGQAGHLSSTLTSTPSFLVCRIDFTSTNVTLRLYVNPPLDSEPVSPEVGPLVEPYFIANLFRLQSGNGAVDGTIDELRLGRTWNDVTPDSPLPPAVSVADASTIEGDAGTMDMVFAVNLSRADAAPVSVDFATQNGSAMAPDDFVATNGTVTFAPGEISRTVTVQIVGDLDPEPNETFQVALSNPVNGTLADALGVGTIRDLDPVNTFTVVNTSDSGAGSLRQAIEDANAADGLRDLIAFDIPGSDVHSIAPLSPLPVITGSTIIDGFSQPGTSPNTLPSDGNDGVWLIRLDGLNAGNNANGLHFTSGSNVVSGLCIVLFSGNGIVLEGGGDSVIAGNLIGVEPLGGGMGPQSIAGSAIGSPMMASASLLDQVALDDSVVSAADGGPDNEAGIMCIDSPRNVIGGKTPQDRNVIARLDFNGDGRVDMGDFGEFMIILAGGSQRTDVYGNALGDANGDGVVNEEDVEPFYAAVFADGAFETLIVRNDCAGPIRTEQPFQPLTATGNSFFNMVGLPLDLGGDGQDECLEACTINVTIHLDGNMLTVSGDLDEVLDDTMVNLEVLAKRGQPSSFVPVTTEVVNVESSPTQPFSIRVPIADSATLDGIALLPTVVFPGGQLTYEPHVFNLDGTEVLEGNLAVSLEAAPADGVAPGQPITYTLTLTNLGPDDPDVLVQITKLSNPVSITPEKGQVLQIGNDLTWEVGAMSAGEVTTLTVVDQTPPSPASIRTLELLAVASGSLIDGNPSDNQASSSVPVLVSADVQVRIVAPDIFRELSRFDIRIVVSNAGPDRAYGIGLTHDLVDSFVIEDSETSKPPLRTWFGDHGEILGLVVPPLEAGEAVTFTFTVAISFLSESLAVVEAHASSGSVPDPDLENNRAAHAMGGYPFVGLSTSVECPEPGTGDVSAADGEDECLLVVTSTVPVRLESSTNLTHWTEVSSTKSNEFRVPLTGTNQFFRGVAPEPAPPELPSVALSQLTLDLDDGVHTNSAWGAADVIFMGTNSVQYFNLSITNDIAPTWPIQNLPLVSTLGTNKPQRLRINFPLSTNGVAITNVTAGWSLTPIISSNAPQATNTFAVSPFSVRIRSGITNQAVTNVPPTGLIGGPATTVRRTKPTFWTRNHGTNESIPSTIRDSVWYLNTTFALGIPFGQLSLTNMKAATGWTPSGVPSAGDLFGDSWVDLKKAYMASNNLPISTVETLDMTVVMQALSNCCDVEIEGDARCAAIVSAVDIGNGDYALTYSHDSQEGIFGGVVREVVIYDSDAGAFQSDLYGSYWTDNIVTFVIECPP